MSRALKGSLIALALLIGSIGAGCGSSSSSGPSSGLARSAPDLPALTWVNGRPDDQTVAAVTSALREGLEVYTRDYGPPSRRIVEIKLYAGATVPFGDGTLQGWTEWTDSPAEATVHLAIGQALPTQWWIHEIHHVHVGDGDHSVDTRWLEVNRLDLSEAQRIWL